MLRVENLCKSFGGVLATNDLSMHFPQDSLTAVIGPNGAGKTTFFNLISGALRPDSGRILLDGKNIAGMSAAQIVRLGVGRSFQVAQLFETLTVEEAIRGTLESRSGRSLRMWRRFPLADTHEQAYEIMAQLNMTSKAKVISGVLSHGDRKLLDMALALALQPKVLLLDEPLAGMGPEEREEMIETVYTLWKKGGLTLVMIEHDMEVVFRVSEYIHVLSYGRLLAAGTVDEVRNNPDVIDAYLGTSREEAA